MNAIHGVPTDIERFAKPMMDDIHKNRQFQEQMKKHIEKERGAREVREGDCFGGSSERRSPECDSEESRQRSDGASIGSQQAFRGRDV
jgi:hypothetical protein